MSVEGPSTYDPSGNGTHPSSTTGDSGESSNTIPWAFIDCPTDTLIILISHMLNLLIQHNDQVVLTPDALTRFHSRAAPGISVVEYLRRIVKYTNMEKIPLLSLLAYIDITCQHLPTFTLSSLTVHRFLIAGVCAGSKAQCDVFCTNAHYAKVGGIKVQELNALEREFLKVTQWNLCCNADLLQRYYTSLIRSHGGFTQALQPAVIPFKAFPRSLSQPPPDEESEEDAEMEDADGDADEGEDGNEVDLGDDRDQDLDQEDEGGQVEDQNAMLDPTADSASQAVVEDNEDFSPSSPSNSRGRHRPSSSRSHRPDEMDVDEDEPISPSTSSIPTSSRSSIRTGSRGRGRAVSLSYTDARPASPLLNRTPVSASPFKTPREVSSSSPLDRQNGALQHELPDEAVSMGSGEGQPSENVGHDEQHDHHNSHHGHHSHHLLKSLVGGIFHRRKSHHHSETPTVPPPPGPASKPTSNGSHVVVPSHPVGQDPSSRLENGTKQRPISQPPLPIVQSTTSLPAGTASAISRNGSMTRSPRSTRSPGLAKPVTPRIRTHEEFGDLGAPLGSSQQDQPVGAADEGNRRARVE